MTTAPPVFQMEKYSKHLEVLVAERTQDLMHEKQKTDRLLYSKIKHTEEVIPETWLPILADSINMRRWTRALNYIWMCPHLFPRYASQAGG